MKFIFIILIILSTTASFGQTSREEKPYAVHNYLSAEAFVFNSDVNENPITTTCIAPNRWAVKLGTVGAQEVVSMILSAKVSGKTITVVGDGTCDISGQGYKIVALYLD